MLSNRWEILELNVSFIYKLYCFCLFCLFFLLTFPSAIKVFHQRDHCTLSVGNG